MKEGNKLKDLLDQVAALEAKATSVNEGKEDGSVAKIKNEVAKLQERAKALKASDGVTGDEFSAWLSPDPYRSRAPAISRYLRRQPTKTGSILLQDPACEPLYRSPDRDEAGKSAGWGVISVSAPGQLGILTRRSGHSGDQRQQPGSLSAIIPAGRCLAPDHAEDEWRSAQTRRGHPAPGAEHPRLVRSPVRADHGRAFSPDRQASRLAPTSAANAGKAR